MVGRNLPFFQQITEGRWATVRTAIPDSRSGLILGDFVSSRISRHEGRGAGKIDPPGGHRLVSRKENLREKNSYRKKRSFLSRQRLTILFLLIKSRFRRIFPELLSSLATLSPSQIGRASCRER